MKPIVIESTETAEGVAQTDVDAWKRGPIPRDSPFRTDSEPVEAPDPVCERLKINDARSD